MFMREIVLILLRVAVLQLDVRGWGMVMVVPIFIYINIEVNNGVRWDGNNCSAVARSGQRMVVARAVIFRKKVGSLFVNRNEKVVPL